MIVLVLDPEVALAEPSVDWIDDVSAGDFRQHGNAASAAICSAINRRTVAASGQFRRFRCGDRSQGSVPAGITRPPRDRHLLGLLPWLRPRRSPVPPSLSVAINFTLVIPRCTRGNRQIQRWRSASPEAIIRVTSKRQGSNSGNPARSRYAGETLSSRWRRACCPSRCR